MMKSKKLVFCGKSEKAVMWGKYLFDLGVDTASVDGSQLLHTIKILKMILRGSTPNVVVVRYLNDYKSFLLSVLTLISNVILVIASKVFDFRIFWIIHNVDRETREHWPAITALRKKLFRRHSSAFFVTDRYLVEQAKKIHHLDYVSVVPFGVSSSRQIPGVGNDFVRKIIENFRNELGEASKNLYIGLCVSSVGDKYVHLRKVVEILRKYNNKPSDVTIAVVMIADFSGSGPEWVEQLNRLKEVNYLKVIDKRILIDEIALSDCFDFIYRSLDDLSIPLTLYRAAESRKPILTHNCGVLPDIVNEYKVGTIFENTAQTDFIDFLKHWDSEIWLDFERDHSWKIGALNIKKAMD